MIQKFDFFNQYESPVLVLCNPNKQQICSLGEAYNVNLSLRMNDLSQVSFTFPRIDGNKDYELLVAKRVVFIPLVGYFIIHQVNETTEGSTPIKNITAYSYEVEMTFKKLNVLSGTYKFYDPINPKDTIIGMILSRMTNWSIGVIDSTLWNLYRTFDVTDTNVYNFLMGEVENAYECVFIFDTIQNTISAYGLKALKKDTDIFLSYENLIKSVSIDENTDELVTALSVYGGGGLDIRGVNPIGGNYIYDFSYFKNTDWMTQGLVNSLTTWENKVIANQTNYANYLTQLRDENSNLIKLNAELKELETSLLAVEGVQKARIEQGLDYSDLIPQINSLNSQISSKKTEISRSEEKVKNINNNLSNISKTLSFESNFSSEQLKELESFKIENTYQNDSFIYTQTMNSVEKQNMAQGLYNHGWEVLGRISQPRFSFNIDSTNFIFLKEFKEFTNQLELGSLITIQLEDGRSVYPILLEISLSYDNPNNFSLTFGNRYRLNGDFVFSDLFGQSIKAGSTVSFESIGWNESTAYVEDTVSKFIESSLDCAKNNVINAENQEIVINQNGLRGKRFIPETETYSPKQCWLTSNSLAFTRDNWNTASLALGEINTPDGGSAYGVVGEVIVGRLLAGNQLTITNEKNTFTVDANGAKLTNGSFILTTTNNKGKIILDPNLGIKVQGNQQGVWKDSFYVDNNGNVTFTGVLRGASGEFSGTVSAGTINGSVITGGSININDRFTVDRYGNCKATSIAITGGTFNAGNITGSTINGTNINGGTITGAIINGGTINVTTNINMGNYLYLSGNNGGISMGGAGSIDFNSRGIIMISARSEVQMDNVSASNIYMGGDRVATEYYVDNAGYLTERQADDLYCANGGGQNLRFQVYGGSLEVYRNGSFAGSIKFD